jgi:hypothetical protein
MLHFIPPGSSRSVDPKPSPGKWSCGIYLQYLLNTRLYNPFYGFYNKNEARCP